MILQLIRRFLRACKRPHAHIPKAPAAVVLDLDYHQHAKRRAQVRRACQANGLSELQTADMLALFERSYRLAKVDPIKQRDVTQDCCDRAAAWARRTRPSWSPKPAA